MAVYRTRVGTIAYKQETTEGTAETSGLSSDVRVMNLSFNPTIAQFERRIQASLLGQFSSVPGAKMGEVSFEVAATGAASLATLGSTGAELHTLLLACGAEPTLTGSTSAQYDFPETSATNTKSVTIRSHIDGLYWTARGCRGNLRISGQVGEPILFGFRFLGAYDHEQAEASVPSVTYQTVMPAPLLSSNASIAGTSLKIRGFEINVENNLVLRPDINNADGYVSAIVTDPIITGTITIEPELVATFDTPSRIEDATEAAINIESGVGTTANHLVISAAGSKAQLTSFTPTDENGLLVYRVGFRVNRSSGDDCLRLKWSA